MEKNGWEYCLLNRPTGKRVFFIRCFLKTANKRMKRNALGKRKKLHAAFVLAWLVLVSGAPQQLENLIGTVVLTLGKGHEG